MNSITRVASIETLPDIEAWGDALWRGDSPDFEPLVRRLQMVMTVGAMGGVSTDAMDEMVGDPGPERHLATDEVFRDMVDAIAKRGPSLAVLSPRELTARLRQSAFYVSSVMRTNVVDQIRSKLIEARVHGHGKGWFQAEVSKIADLSLGHIENVFRTNVEAAAGAARWKQAHDPDTESMWCAFRYWNPRDDRSRPLHRAMHGFVAVKDDPIWPIIWTPNGFQCRCKCRPLEWDEGIKAGLFDKRRQLIARRVFVDDLQRRVVHSIENESVVVVGRRALRFPDEGFRGNALIDVI